MKPERWQQIESVFQQALARHSSNRASFLAEACLGDSELRREVESLLVANADAGSFNQSPAAEMTVQLMAEDHIKSARQAIGPYKIISRLGAGGMGEVFLGEDSRLGRKVALKLLPDYFAGDEDRLGRFKREARAASALNHANVATIYEIGEADGSCYIAMEYVEGQTLSARINGQPLAPAEIVDIAAQAADALDEAHTKGITHRDIKSANIMLTARGQVKMLDFGLAKMRAAERQDGASQMTTAAATEPGLVMGTVQYMSPEQALGREVDGRSDLFSLGVVMYEMATGRLPFSGATATETIEQIRHEQPAAIGRFNYKVTGELERIIRKCLEKDRERRYQRARELLVDLKNLKRDSDSGTTSIRRTTLVSTGDSRRYLLLAVAAVVVVVGLGIYQLTFRSGPSGKPIESLAVLPLVNAGGDPDAEYLSDGITETIINKLSQIPKLRVMARSTVFTYKGKGNDPRKVGKELGVGAVLTGNLIRRGDRLIIGMELVDVGDGRQLWGEQYNKRQGDILAVQQDISREVTNGLRLKLSGEESKLIARNYTENTEAYQLYLKGRYFWSKFNEDGLKKSIDYFNQAIAIDSDYALAYTGLANAYNIQGAIGIVPPALTCPKAKWAAEKAVALDDTLGQSHQALGGLKLMCEWDWSGADRELTRAMELNPTSGEPHELYAYLCLATGQLEKAVSEMRRAQELAPLSSIINTDVASALYYQGNYDEAINVYRKGEEIDPHFAPPPLFLPAQIYEQKGEYDRAGAECQKAFAIFGRDPAILSVLGYVYAVTGKRREAQTILNEIETLWGRGYFSPIDVALVHTGLGDKDGAFAWLTKAYDARDPQLIFVNVEPELKSLHTDPRFKDLLRRMRLLSVN
jgi:serine/threonine protein kinase/Flp pilus assembly protein TadD